MTASGLQAPSLNRMRRGAGKTVFLDKDGTVLADVPYNVDPARMVWAPEAAEGVRLLAAAGYELIVITNQSGVARGYFPEEDLVGVAGRLSQMMATEGARLAGFYYCPHHPEGTVAPYRRVCGCRKPAPGLLRQAMADCQIEPGQAWFVGDILDDVAAGNQAGCRTVMVNTGGETEWQLGRDRVPHYMTANLAVAARTIIAADRMVAEVPWNG